MIDGQGNRALLPTLPVASSLWAFLVLRCPLVAMQSTCRASAETQTEVSWLPGPRCAPCHWLLMATPRAWIRRFSQHLPPSRSTGKSPHNIILDGRHCNDAWVAYGWGRVNLWARGFLGGRPTPLIGPEPVEEEGPEVGTPHSPISCWIRRGPSTTDCASYRADTFLSSSYPEASLRALPQGMSPGRNLGFTSFHLLALLDRGKVRPGAGKGLARLVTAEPEGTRSS